VTATIKQPLSWMAVLGSNDICIGHAISRGRIGVEAFDINDKSIGLFRTLADAKAALASLAAPS
jgi:hypothetical protein